jgi:serine/threonine protein kinase
VASETVGLDEARLLLSDFGVAFRPADKSRFKSYTPLVIRPPEAFFEPKTPLSFASDIWSLGCTIFELFAHRSLIDGIIAPQDDITARQIHLQGPLPSEWWDRFENRSEWFDDNGNPLSNEYDIWNWDRRFDQWVQMPRRSFGMVTIDDEEKAALFELLRLMLTWRPKDRPNAEQVLGAAWTKRWALPAYEGSRKTWE